jgi:predicted permease
MWILSWHRLSSFFRRHRLDEEDFKDEIRAHLAIAASEKMADGADRQTAHYSALKEFGNVTLTTEATRKVWTPWWIDALHDQVSDVRYAMRALAKNPLFALTVIGVLTLGIGLNAAVFTMVKSMVLSPVAGVDGAARTAVIYAESTTGRELRVSYPDYVHLRRHDDAFADLFGSVVATVGLGRGRSARSVWSEIVTGNYFQILGVRAERGRTLLPSDEVAPGRHRVIVISDGLWRRDFAGDPDIVGKTVEINNHLMTVVGVADPKFHGTTVVYDVEVFIPVMMARELGFTFGSRHTTGASLFADRSVGLFYPQGYLRPGRTLAQARAQTDAIWAALSMGRPLTEPVDRLRVVRFWQTPNGAPTFMLPTLVVLSAMGLLVLMIACANIAGLVVVRGVSRAGEIALRLALGATRTRIVRLLIVENLILAVPGALLGILLARHGIPVLVGYAEGLAAPQRVFFNVDVDGFVIGFAALVACGSALMFGFVPALQSSRVDLVSVINADASPRGAARGRLRSGLVVAQVAVSLLLLVGAGLVTRSLEAARRANPGFDAAHVVSVALDVKQNGYDDSRGRVFYRNLLDAARDDAAIESATLAAFTPLNFLDTRVQPVAIEGYDARRGEDLAFMWNTVAPDYFRTLRIGVVAGRAFEDRDDETGVPVVMVNNTLAQRFWGDAAQAIGKRMRVADGDWRTVIGVAADVKYSRINESPRPYFYLPFLQSYRSSMVLHTRGPASVDLVDRTRARVAALDSELPITFAKLLTEQIDGALIFYNLTATMLFIFGTAGMVLSALGTYGLVSYTVKQSTHEIGIRMALGASGLSIVRTFLGRGLKLGAIGTGLGITVALGISGLLRAVLFGVSATDGVSFARALVIVLGGVILATFVPAWRAARTDPLTALRHH